MAVKALRRDLEAEVRKHFQGTPEERMKQALEMGASLFELYLSMQPPGTSRRAAEERIRSTTHQGRRSRVMARARG
jgi:urease accessory protein UreF